MLASYPGAGHTVKLDYDEERNLTSIIALELPLQTTSEIKEKIEICAKECATKGGGWKKIRDRMAKCAGKKVKDLGWRQFYGYIYPEACKLGRNPCGLKNPDTGWKQACCDENYIENSIRCFIDTKPYAGKKCVDKRTPCYIKAAFKEEAVAL